MLVETAELGAAPAPTPVTPSIQVPGQKRVAAHAGSARRHREELREFLARFSDHTEQAGCGRTIRKGRVGSASEVLEVVTSCRRKWLCPTCGHSAWRKQASELERRLREWTSMSGHLALLTLTQSHCLTDGLARLWSQAEKGWEALVRGSGWTVDKLRFGVSGYVAVTEVVHHPGTGWNVHFHVVLLLSHFLSVGLMAELKSSVGQRFIRGITQARGVATFDGQRIQAVEPGTEGRLANYLFKGTTIRRKNLSRTPFAIASDLMSTGEGYDLYREFSAAVSDKRGVKQLRQSKHLDRICAHGPDALLDK